MPLMIIVAGASVAAASALLAWGGLATLLVLISVFLSPAAINATWIINKEAWPTPGRLYTAYAYFFLFYLSFLLQWRPSRKIIEFTTLAMIYLFFTLASQQANALELKTAYETSFINRIVQRVEPIQQGAIKFIELDHVLIGDCNKNASTRLKQPIKLLK
jgi:hypothetical protein